MDFRFPELGFKVGCGIALCVDLRTYTRFSVGSEFQIWFGRLLKLAGIFVDEICYAGEPADLSSSKTKSGVIEGENGTEK
jgi:hypothetical protein